MYLKVMHRNGDTDFYEGNRIEFRPIPGTFDKLQYFVYEKGSGEPTLITLECSNDNVANYDVYILNDYGRTIEALHF